MTESSQDGIAAGPATVRAIHIYTNEPGEVAAAIAHAADVEIEASGPIWMQLQVGSVRFWIRDDAKRANNMYVTLHVDDVPAAYQRLCDIRLPVRARPREGEPEFLEVLVGGVRLWVHPRTGKKEPETQEPVHEIDGDDRPGYDLESRAILDRVTHRGALLIQTLDTLSPEAAARIGLTDEDRDWLSRITHRALWASTADLHQQGRNEFAQRVVMLSRSRRKI